MILVDGNNFCWRAHWAGHGLESDGRPTAVMHVGISMLAGMARVVKPQRIIFLWDYPGKSWRAGIYPEYKANRAKMQVDRTSVYSQIDTFKTFLSAIGIRQLTVDGLEADDLAGCLSAVFEDVILVSNDTDWYQLLRFGVTILRNWKGKQAEWMDVDKLRVESGIGSEDWPVFLALSGKSSNNIPNVRRLLGPETAKKMMKKGDVQAQLSDAEQEIFKRNLSLCTILRKPPEGVHFILRKAERDWGEMCRIMMEYDLVRLWDMRKVIWKIGEWGNQG